MPEQNAFAPRSILLPAVLQVEGHAPSFGTIASLSEQGLAFNFQTTPLAQQAVGLTARLDFDLLGLHHSCKGLILHVQDRRALLSLRETSTNIHAALRSINRDSVPALATRLASLQIQQACHAQFMSGMKAVVDDFYLLLSGEIQHSLDQKKGLEGLSELTRLQSVLNPLRPRLTRLFTHAYPMYPEQPPSPVAATSAKPGDPVDMERVDEWIRRTTIAQQVNTALSPLPEEFNQHYSCLLNDAHKQTAHPYQPDSVLELLSDLMTPLRLGPDARTLCYKAMGRAFQKHALTIYPDMLRSIRDTPPESFLHAHPTRSLEEWLRISSTASAHVGAPSADATQINALAALLERLTDNLGKLSARLPATSAPPQESEFATHAPIQALLARDRIFNRFLPAETGLETAESLIQGAPDPLENGSRSPQTGHALGGVSSLDSSALQGLYAVMRQPTPFELGPEKLAQASQVRALMLQAQGLLLEYTLNGLTYPSQPDHPAWTLLNALDALHQGADNRGQFLDPVLHHAITLAMQWLLGQEDVDAALVQVNTLLATVNTQLRADRQLRRAQYLERLGALASDPTLISTGWCVVKRDEEAIPYEVLGQHGGSWALLDRSGAHTLEIPASRFLDEIDSGLIEEADSFDAPFLERIADATLTSSLNAVHTYTWQDPASGCLKRSALMDELERRLAHPVTEPPTFCALIEIPTMRPSLSSLPGDALTVIQKRTGEVLLAALEKGEQCGRLSDVSFLMVFSPQDPDRLTRRLTDLRAEIEQLHPEWKMIGAVVPLADGETGQTPSSALRRANQACAPLRQKAQFDLSCLSNRTLPSNPFDALPFASLYLRCQKIAPCDAHTLSHYEVLLGISTDLIPHHTTQSFVVMAEQTGRVHELDKWVLQSVLEWMACNPAAVDQLSGLSVNLSGHSLSGSAHVDAMVELLSSYPALSQKLILEVTETAAIDNLEVAVRSLRRLRKMGCRIALDDFGSGYSSYNYIRRLPLDYLKIDGTYIRNLLTDKTDQALTASMVDVAHALGLKVIAEYVDSEAVYTWLKALGVDYVQGYWVHEPERLDGLVLS